MTNPLIAEITRGTVVESRHSGAVAVVDADGGLLLALGDIERPVFPRSTVKALQALPLIESGAADRFGFGDAELALAIASHTAEPRHVATARRMLGAAGLGEECLACGPQWPERSGDRARLDRMGASAGRIHNNCSGKHAGFLCTAVALGHGTRGYERADHPVMREVIAAMEDVTGASHGPATMAIDGCSIPTFAIPLRSLAHGFARFGTGAGLLPERARAAARLRAAAAAEPFMVDGTGKFCTVAMEALGQDAFVKLGAEGVYVAALPGQGLGIAVKSDDGGLRAAEVATAALLMRLLGLDEGDAQGAVIASFVRPPVRERNGVIVGEMRPAGALEEALGKLRT